MSEDCLARLDLRFVDSGDFVRYLFLQDAEGKYLHLSTHTVAAPVRATADGEPVGDIADGIVNRVAPDGVHRDAVRLLISPAESLKWDHHSWQLDITNPGGHTSTKVAGQIFAATTS